jgi:uncharacterized membrane protein YgdD (TMEM256/DUF423 family)
MQKAIVVKGLTLILVSIILGAFVAHYLEVKLTDKALSSFQVGVRYQTYGGILLLLLSNHKLLSRFKKSINLFFIGNLLFSSSIYYLSLTDVSVLDKFVGPITPIGGFLMILSLVIILFRVIKLKQGEI